MSTKDNTEKLWFSLQNAATIQQKDEVGKAFISRVLGLGDDVANRFAQDDFNTFHQVGKRQSGAEDYVSDLAGFWEKIRIIFPETYSDDDIRFLVEKGGVVATVRFMWILGAAFSEQSPVLEALSISANTYK